MITIFIDDLKIKEKNANDKIPKKKCKINLEII